MTPYRVVPDTLSKDVVTCLRALLEDAQAGKLHGIVFAGMYKGKRLITNTAGEAAKSPIFARGMVAVLDDEVRRQMG